MNKTLFRYGGIGLGAFTGGLIYGLFVTADEAAEPLTGDVCHIIRIWTGEHAAAVITAALVWSLLAVFLEYKRTGIGRWFLLAWLPVLSFNLYAAPYLAFVFHAMKSAPWFLPAAILALSCLPFRPPSTAPRESTARRSRNGLLILVPSVVFAGTILAAALVFPHLGLSGDEPAYLEVARSIYRDGDLDLRNQEPGYSPFWPDDWCRLHHLNRLEDGRLISIHAPGLPLLLALPVGRAGRMGGAVAMACLAAMTALLLYRILRRFTGDGFAAWVTVFVSLGSPLFFFGFQFYPELPSACILALALDACLNAATGGWLLVVSAGLAFLPWLHIKYAPLAAAMWLMLIWRHDFHRRVVSAMLPLPAISAVMYLWMNAAFYGSLSPFAAYRQFVQSTGIVEGNLLYGLAFYILDRRHSFILYGPMFLLWGVGMAIMLRRHAFKTAVMVGLPVLIYLPVVAGHVSDRWLGWSPPDRFWVPLLPFLAVGAVEVFRSKKAGEGFGTALVLFGCIQVAVAWTWVFHPGLIHQRERIFQSWPGLAFIFPRVPDQADPVRVGLMGAAYNIYLLGVIWVLHRLIGADAEDDVFRRRLAGGLLVWGVLVVLPFVWGVGGAGAGSAVRIPAAPAAGEAVYALFERTAGAADTGWVVADEMRSCLAGADAGWVSRFVSAPAEGACSGGREEDTRMAEVDREALREAVAHGDVVSALLYVEPLIRGRRAAEVAPEIREAALDLYRARRSWEQVIEVAEALLERPGKRYSRAELELVRCAARESLARAYNALAASPAIPRDRRRVFRAQARRLTCPPPGNDHAEVPLRVFPELAGRCLWPW